MEMNQIELNRCTAKVFPILLSKEGRGFFVLA